MGPHREVVITVVGWPRSGTHWTKAMLEYALEEEVAHSHRYRELVGKRCVLVIRDPRDAFASHWRLYQRANPGLKTERGFVECFLKGKGRRQHEWNIGWTPYTRELVEWSECRNVPLVRYERLYEAPRETLTETLAGIGRQDVSWERVDRAVCLTRGRRCDPSDLPVDRDMGRPGKWRTQLRWPTVRALLVYCGHLMMELDYEIGKVRS